MDDLEEDKIANQILDGLPPSFMVFGTKKELDPIEEFWMNKLTNIERQYDQHIVELERKLLNDRAQKRSIKKQARKIAELQEDLTERSAEIQSLKSKQGTIQGKLKEKEYEAKSLQSKLERTDLATKNVSKRMMNERHSRKQVEKEVAELKNRLRILEKEKAQLHIDVDIKESEKGRVEDREAALSKERWTYVRNLTELDTERRIQTDANFKLCQDIEKLLNVEKTLEGGLLKERRLMGEMVEEIREQRKQHQDALRQLEIASKEKQEAADALDYSGKKRKDLERRVNHWKEELHFKELDNRTQSKEIKDLKRRNGMIRCALADTKHKLNTCLSELKCFEKEKRRADVELQSATRHAEALQLEIRKNELRKYQLAERILKAHPFLLKSGATTGGKPRRSPDDDKQQSSSAATKNEIESYKKKIWKLERTKDEIERKLRELRRKENIYRMKLDKYAGMEKQIFWTGKAMAKLEGDRNRLEEFLKTMESNMPMKVPFKKLVTDPSVLDRLAKNKILQKRIFHQAEKIEELKSNARRILQFREEQFGAMSQPPEEIPIWKLSYWQGAQMNADNMFSGMQLDVLSQPQEKRASLTSKPFTGKDFYKNYMQYLSEEIPKVKGELNFLEKKKLYIQLGKESGGEGEDKTRKQKGDAQQQMSTLLSGLLADDGGGHGHPSEDGEEGEGESGDDDGQCTPELSMHGSSYNDDQQGKAEGSSKLMKGDHEGDGPSIISKAPKIQKQPAQAGSSSTEDGRDDEESSDTVSDIPSDKSSEH